MNKLKKLIKEEEIKLKKASNKKQAFPYTDIGYVVKIIGEKILKSLPKYPSKSDLVDAFSKSIRSIKIPSYSPPEIQKVKIVDQKEEKEVQKVKVVNPIEQKEVEFPKVQKIEGEVDINNLTGLLSVMKRIEKKLDKLKPLTKVNIDNLPITRILNSKDKKQVVLPVEVVNQKFLVNAGSSSTAKNTDDRVWFREEFTYETVAGQAVPTKVEKWNHNSKLTERFEYDSNANPVVKSRTLETSSGTGV